MLTILNKSIESLTTLMYGSKASVVRTNANSPDFIKNLEIKRVMSQLKKGHKNIQNFNIFKEAFETKYPKEKIYYGSKGKVNQTDKAKAVIDELNFSSTDKEGANLDNIVLENIIFDNSRLEGVSMKSSLFIKVSFKHCDFKGASSEDSIYDECYFDFSKFKECTFEKVRFKNCDFANVPIGEAIFRDCIIENKEITKKINSTEDLMSLTNDIMNQSNKSFKIVSIGSP